ncbi:hypothetical protein COLO4_33415 [Corchorus olitorius]|uniref:Uncharacterized protein n=1 Tax=Corchorus olitorius TaxID=93759 RepID=A0A1R3GTV3_9ROSI|nr:hypothetical protein COLO4_33415 [Corchorus olitorius]
MEMMRKQISQLASDMSELKTQGQQRIPSQPNVPSKENTRHWLGSSSSALLSPPSLAGAAFLFATTNETA